MSTFRHAIVTIANEIRACDHIHPYSLHLIGSEKISPDWGCPTGNTRFTYVPPLQVMYVYIKDWTYDTTS